MYYVIQTAQFALGLHFLLYSCLAVFHPSFLHRNMVGSVGSVNHHIFVYSEK